MINVHFVNKPELTPSSNGHKFELTNDFFILVPYKRMLRKITIPAGFWTDLASTGIFSPLNKTMLPAILHDYLYYKQTIGNDKITRKEADEIFLKAMKHTRVNYFKRYMYYYGVRIGGFKAWNKYKIKDEK